MGQNRDMEVPILRMRAVAETRCGRGLRNSRYLYVVFRDLSRKPHARLEFFPKDCAALNCGAEKLPRGSPRDNPSLDSRTHWFPAWRLPDPATVAMRPIHDRPRLYINSGCTSKKA